jgi:ribosomal protein L37E
MPQVHPGHDLLIVPGSLIDCCLALLPEVFIGVKGVGTAILNTIKYCDCNRAGKHHQYEVAHQHATFHVGYGKASKWHQYSDFGKKHLYRSDEIKNLLSSMNIAVCPCSKLPMLAYCSLH